MTPGLQARRRTFRVRIIVAVAALTLLAISGFAIVIAAITSHSGGMTTARAAADTVNPTCAALRAQFGPGWPCISVPNNTPTTTIPTAPTAPTGPTDNSHANAGVYGGPGPGEGNGTPIVPVPGGQQPAGPGAPAGPPAPAQVPSIPVAPSPGGQADRFPTTGTGPAVPNPAQQQDATTAAPANPVLQHEQQAAGSRSGAGSPLTAALLAVAGAGLVVGATYRPSWRQNASGAMHDPPLGGDPMTSGGNAPQATPPPDNSSSNSGGAGTDDSSPSNAQLKNDLEWPGTVHETPPSGPTQGPAPTPGQNLTGNDWLQNHLENKQVGDGPDGPSNTQLKNDLDLPGTVHQAPAGGPDQGARPAPGQQLGVGDWMANNFEGKDVGTLNQRPGPDGQPQYYWNQANPDGTKTEHIATSARPGPDGQIIYSSPDGSHIAVQPNPSQYTRTWGTPPADQRPFREGTREGWMITSPDGTEIISYPNSDGTATVYWRRPDDPSYQWHYGTLGADNNITRQGTYPDPGEAHADATPSEIAIALATLGIAWEIGGAALGGAALGDGAGAGALGGADALGGAGEAGGADVLGVGDASPIGEPPPPPPLPGRLDRILMENGEDIGNALNTGYKDLKTEMMHRPPHEPLNPSPGESAHPDPAAAVGVVATFVISAIIKAIADSG